MKIEITINGVTKTYTAGSDELQTKDWNEILFKFIEETSTYL